MMKFLEALQEVRRGARARRTCWQPGWIELGTFQDLPTVYYVNPSEVMVHDHLMPAMRVTYTPLTVVKTNPRTGEQYLHRDDELATNWEIVK